MITKINVNEGKKILLELLEEFAEFCEQNDLKYGLAYGTLLGAVREKGFIKWDYDVDVIMPRNDYIKFMEIYKSDKNVALCNHNDEKYDAMVGTFARRDVWRIPRWINKYSDKYLLGLDVYVIDCVPDGGWKLTDYIIKCKILLFLYKIKEVKLKKQRGLLVNLLLKLLKGIIFCLNKDMIFKGFNRLTNNNIDKYHKNTMIITDVLDNKKIIFNKDVFFFDKKISFEGRNYYVPRGFDIWLRALYGDYLKIPEQKQIEKELQIAKQQFEWCKLEI